MHPWRERALVAIIGAHEVIAMNTNGTRPSADRMLQKLRAALHRFNSLPPAERERRMIAARLRRLLNAPRLSTTAAGISARLPAADIRAAPRREGNVIDFVEHAHSREAMRE